MDANSYVRARPDGLPMAGTVASGKTQVQTRRRAASLLELVLCIAIVTIVAAIAVPRYGRASARYQVDLAARRVAADLRMAQSRARAASSPCTVNFSLSSSQYQLLNMASLDGVPGDYSVALSEEPYRAVLASVDLGGDAQVTFDGWGVPDIGGAVTVAVGSMQKTVVVDGETGRIDVQ